MNSVNNRGSQQTAVQDTKKNQNIDKSTIDENAKKFLNTMSINNKDKAIKHKEHLNADNNSLLKDQYKDNKQLYAGIMSKNGKKDKNDLVLPKQKNKHEKTASITNENKHGKIADITDKNKLARDMSNEVNQNQSKLVKHSKQETKENSQELTQVNNLVQNQAIQLNEAVAINKNNVDLNNLLQKVADQIYTTAISTKNNINGSEIRISLKNSVLVNTEVHIQRIGNELTVSFNTSADSSKFVLVNNEATLQKMLAEKFDDAKIQININLSQEHQGRSRNQYVADEQWDDNAKR